MLLSQLFAGFFVGQAADNVPAFARGQVHVLRPGERLAVASGQKLDDRPGGRGEVRLDRVSCRHPAQLAVRQLHLDRKLHHRAHGIKGQGQQAFGPRPVKPPLLGFEKGFGECGSRGASLAVRPGAVQSGVGVGCSQQARQRRNLQALGACRILLTPDHRTPISLRTHSREPVPFVLWGSGFAADGLQAYGEREGEKGSLHLEHGHELMEYLVGKKAV